MQIDTRTIHNFLNDSEINTIENLILSTIEPWENWNDRPNGSKVMSGHYYVFQYYDIKYKIIKDILQPKFDKEFGSDLYIQQIHIFDSYDPYTIHSDVNSGGEIVLEAPVPAWTFIIPLSTVESHTIVFNEQSEIKNPWDYFQKTKPFETPSIDLDTYNKYFSHVQYESFNWLTIEDIFEWNKGDLFAASRYKFHTSDNFLANGVKNKKALIAWTSLPNNL